MDIIKYPDEEMVDKAMQEDEPMMAVISFDGQTAVISQLDDGFEHHILLQKAGFKDTDIDKFFRIIFDSDGADWTFVCPPDYKSITFKDKRIRTFYRDGLDIIGDFLTKTGYPVNIEIPKRYRRHIDYLYND